MSDGGAGVRRARIRDLQPHQGIAGRTGRIAEVHQAAVELQLEAAAAQHIHRVGRGGGRVGGVGGDQAGAAGHLIGVTALVIECCFIAEAVGQGSAIDPHVAEALAGAVYHQLHRPAKSQALVGQGGAGGHAALLAGRHAQPSIADLPAGAAAVGGHLNLIGHQVEVAGGVHAAGPLHRQAAAGPKGQRAAAHQFAADGHIARQREVAAGLRGREQVEEALQVEVAAAAQAEIRRRQRRPPQARGAAVEEQGAGGGRAQAGTAAHQRRLAQNLQITSTGAGAEARGLHVAAEAEALALKVDAAAAARHQGGEAAEHATGGSGWHRDGDRHQAGCGHAGARRGAGRQGGQLEMVGVVADHPIGHAVLQGRKGSLLHPVVDHLAAIGQAVVGNAEARRARGQGSGRQHERRRGQARRRGGRQQCTRKGQAALGGRYQNRWGADGAAGGRQLRHPAVHRQGTAGQSRATGRHEGATAVHQVTEPIHQQGARGGSGDVQLRGRADRTTAGIERYRISCPDRRAGGQIGAREQLHTAAAGQGGGLQQGAAGYVGLGTIEAREVGTGLQRQAAAAAGRAVGRDRDRQGGIAGQQAADLHTARRDAEASAAGSAAEASAAGRVALKADLARAAVVERAAGRGREAGHLQHHLVAGGRHVEVIGGIQQQGGRRSIQAFGGRWR